ncbi:MAG: uncharacterized protein KVP18_005211 [Porospora cf. gigantea A]|uniref:uncharacterized protein n=1 Tax=Porospora cf. gigantea A TaxID=2853593 RepID=UPI00355A7804|nr:MAG: hypothetical protein KVP18_005211 [Porospora cf. gigantea A]
MPSLTNAYDTRVTRGILILGLLGTLLVCTFMLNFVPYWHYQVIYLPGGLGVEFSSDLYQVTLASECNPLWHTAPKWISKLTAKITIIPSICRWLVSAYDGLDLYTASVSACRDDALGITVLQNSLCDTMQRLATAATIVKLGLVVSLAFIALGIVCTFVWVFIHGTLRVRQMIIVAQLFSLLALSLSIFLDRVFGPTITQETFLSLFYAAFVLFEEAPAYSIHLGFFAFCIMAIMEFLCFLLVPSIISEKLCVDSVRFNKHLRDHEIMQALTAEEKFNRQEKIDAAGAKGEAAYLAAALVEEGDRLGRLHRVVGEREKKRRWFQ